MFSYCINILTYHNFFYREFSKEKERRENRDEFLKQLAAERAEAAVDEWQVAAEEAARKEAEEKRKSNILSNINNSIFHILRSAKTVQIYH